MRALGRLCFVLLTGFVLGVAGPARAGHHLWDFSEVYTNSDGSVQFIEMIGGADGEQALGPWSITSAATGKTFTFGTDLPSTLTAGKWVLIATAGFASIPGAPVPDYTLPSDNFVGLSGDTLTYAVLPAGDQITFTTPELPTDGINSLIPGTPHTTGTNSPTNFVGTSGSIDLSTSVPALARWGTILLVGLMVLGVGRLLARSPAGA